MDHYNNNREKIKGAAIEFCRNEFLGSRSSDDCLNIVAPSRFIDAGAFNLCLEQSTSLRQIECLSVIVNKAFHPSLIEECKEQSTSLECLSKYGFLIDNEEDESVVIIIQNGQYIEYSSPECKYENFHGLYPEGGGCNFYGCWIAGGGCNFHGCWYPRGFCEFDGCINEAPKNNICK